MDARLPRPTKQTPHAQPRITIRGSTCYNVAAGPAKNPTSKSYVGHWYKAPFFKMGPIEGSEVSVVTSDPALERSCNAISEHEHAVTKISL
jgi:hypothetical protein